MLARFEHQVIVCLRARRRARRSPPLSPTARRTALMRLSTVESETTRPPPHRGHQVISADDPVAVPQEIKQQSANT
jgi:hypothetical protein